MRLYLIPLALLTAGLDGRAGALIMKPAETFDRATALAITQRYAPVYANRVVSGSLYVSYVGTPAQRIGTIRLQLQPSAARLYPWICKQRTVNLHLREASAKNARDHALMFRDLTVDDMDFEDSFLDTRHSAVATKVGGDCTKIPPVAEWGQFRDESDTEQAIEWVEQVRAALMRSGPRIDVICSQDDPPCRPDRKVVMALLDRPVVYRELQASNPKQVWRLGFDVPEERRSAVRALDVTFSGDRITAVSLIVSSAPLTSPG